MAADGRREMTAGLARGIPGLAFGLADVQKTARRAAPMSAARPGDNQGISLKRMSLDD